MKFYQIVGFFKKAVDDKWQSIPPCGIPTLLPYDELHQALKAKFEADYVMFTVKEINLEGANNNEPLGDK